MSKKNGIFTVIILLCCIVCFALLYFCFNSIFESATTYGIVCSILSMLCSIACLLYIFDGCRKNSVNYYRGLLLLLAARQAVELVVTHVFDANAVISIIVTVFLLMMAFVKDLGITKSTIFCGIILLLRLSQFIISITTPSIVGLLLSLLLCACTYAKYKNKLERNTK